MTKTYLDRANEVLDELEEMWDYVTLRYAIHPTKKNEEETYEWQRRYGEAFQALYFKD